MSKTGKSPNSVPENAEDFKKKFGELPLNQKLKTLIQLEVVTFTEALDTIIDKSISAGENVMHKINESTGISNSKK